MLLSCFCLCVFSSTICLTFPQRSRDARKSDSEGAFFYQIITEKDDTVKIAQVQQLLELSFISADIILSEVCGLMDIVKTGSLYNVIPGF